MLLMSVQGGNRISSPMMSGKPQRQLSGLSVCVLSQLFVHVLLDRRGEVQFVAAAEVTVLLHNTGFAFTSAVPVQIGLPCNL